MPSTQHLLLKQILTAATGPLARKRPGLGSMRLAMEISSLFQFMPWGVHLEKTTIEGMTAEWTRPAGADPRRVLLYFHGGGYVLGSLNTHRSLVGTLAKRCNTNALAINYRKAPDYPFPSALDDALLAYHWLLKQGFAPHNIILAGDSAGGGLALALLITLREVGEPLPAAAIGLSPWTDLAMPDSLLRRVAREETQLLEALQMRGWGPHYAGDTPLTHPLVSPSRAAVHGLPPLLIQISDTEVLCESVLCFTDKARLAGVVVTLQSFTGLVHWWHLFWRLLPEAREALDNVATFVHGIWAAPLTAIPLLGTEVANTTALTTVPRPRKKAA
jgi:acetyl esterase/lipase